MKFKILFYSKIKNKMLYRGSEGCISDYKRIPEKLHQFCVIKNEDIKSKWINAITRKYLMITYNIYVCEKYLNMIRIVIVVDNNNFHILKVTVSQIITICNCQGQ